MVTKGSFPLIAALVVCFAGGIAVCMAQQIRYMDSSGNLHFVDDLSQVPGRYRQQVVPYTPTPVLDKRQLQMKLQQEQAALRRQQQEERLKKAEAQRLKFQQERAEEQKRKRLREQESQTGFKTGG
jgi:hypothetical protein